MRISKKIGVVIVALIAIIPLIIGLLVSMVVFPALSINNDWIGFWGSYAGAIIGGIITLLVLKSTLHHNEQLQENQKKQELCNQIAKLISTFSIEMLAYRSKWNFLEKESKEADKEDGIDRRDAIELGATKEIPRGIYFELDILLGDIESAEELLTGVENIVNSKFNRNTVSESNKSMQELREKARRFIKNYMKAQ